MLDGRWRTSIEKGLRPVGVKLRRAGITADAPHRRRRRDGRVPRGRHRHRPPLARPPASSSSPALPDALDGAVAKAAGTAGPRGAFFDSVADRVTDTLLLGGVAWYLADHPARAASPLLPDGRPRRLADHLLRAGQGRVARLRAPRAA